MNLFQDTEATRLVDENSSGLSRRSFFKRASLVGATAAVGLGGLVNVTSALGQDAEEADHRDEKGHLRKGDRDILVAAQIAEALAVTTYTNIINLAPFFSRIPSDD